MTTLTAHRPRVIKYERPPLTPYQIDGIFHKLRYGLIEASTKSGKTHGSLAWLFEQAITLGGPNRNFWWVAPVYPQAEIAFRRMAAAIPLTLRKVNYSDLSITLLDGTRIVFKSGEKPDNLYGEDVYAAVVDEASRLREEAWHALRSTLTATRGPVRIIGNVKGRKNWFYHLCRKAQAGEQDHHYAHINAYAAAQAGVIDPKEIEDAKRVLPEHVFKELFMAEASEDAANPFGASSIRACIMPVLSPLAPVAFGVDLAKSVDWTVIIGLDENGHVCRFERFQMPWGETLERVKLVIGKIKTLVDSTGVGDPIVEGLQRTMKNVEGYKFSSESKQRLMEGLAVAIQQGRIHYPEGVIVNELDSFEYEYTRTGVRYSAPEGMHDDTVCALALAVAARFQSSGVSKWRPIE